MTASRIDPQLPTAGWHAIVAGNGPSLLNIDRSRIDPNARIVRVNNFFFEDDYLLGKRVDLVQVGGDRWIFPFYAKTLAQLAEVGVYEVSAWSCHQPHIAARGARKLPVPFVSFTYKDAATKEAIEALCRKHGKTPTTGILAVINAHALGATTISLCGIDFYQNGRRYAYATPEGSNRLLKKTFKDRDRSPFHSRELDLAIIRYLNERPDLHLQRMDEENAYLEFLPLAPASAQGKLAERKHETTKQWAAFVGIYPFILMNNVRLIREIYITRFRSLPRRGEVNSQRRT